MVDVPTKGTVGQSMSENSESKSGSREAAATAMIGSRWRQRGWCPFWQKPLSATFDKFTASCKSKSS